MGRRYLRFSVLQFVVEVYSAAFAIMIALTAGSFAVTIEVNVPPPPNVKEVNYRMYVPDSIPYVRCVLLRQHGCSRNGLKLADDPQFQAIARKHGCVLLGSYLRALNCADWRHIDRGTEGCFFAALDSLARKSGHPEIKTAPWAAWGHSGGAYWLTQMMVKYPTRFVTGYLRSGGDNSMFDSSILATPVVVEMGALNDAVNDSVVFKTQRSRGALWAFTLNPRTGHEVGWGRFFAGPTSMQC